MPFKKKTATTETAVTATADRNEPITVAFESYEAECANNLEDDLDITYDLLPEPIQAGIDKLLSMFNVESKGDSAIIFKYRAEKQQLLGALALAYADGMVVKLGDYSFIIPSDADITEKLYSFNFTTDHGGTLILDRGGVSLVSRCFFRSEIDTKSTNFSARMMGATTAGDISEFLSRGEDLRKWGDEPEKASYTIHDISAVPDREDETKIAYAILLAEDASGNPIRLYAPGDYSDYAGIEFAATAEKDGYVFKIADKELKISAGGSYCKLHELEVGAEHTVVSFDGGINKFNNWQATLQLEDGRKVNGNKAINSLLQGKPDDCISADKPATLVVDSVQTKTGRDGKERNYVTARILLASAGENELLNKLKARMAQQKQAVAVGNPL